MVLPPSENGTVRDVELFGNQLSKASPEQVTSLWNQTSNAWWLAKDDQEEESLWEKYMKSCGSNRGVKKIDKTAGSEGLRHILNKRLRMVEMLDVDNKSKEVEEE